MISFVIPCYNSERYIRRCLDSLIKIKSNDIEIIVIDDGSSDNSVKIVDELSKNSDKEIRMLKLNHLGVSNARNKGLMASKGEYICFIDSDDTVKSKKITQIINYLNNETNKIDLLMTNVFEDEKETIDGITLKKQQFLNYYYPLYGKQEIHLLHGKFFNKKMLLKNHIKFLNDVKVGEDLIFNLDCIDSSNNIMYVDFNFYRYEISNNSVTTKFNPNAVKDKILIFRKLIYIYSKYRLDKTILDSILLKMIYSIAINRAYKNDRKLESYRKIVNVKRNYKLLSTRELMITKGKHLKFLNMILLQSNDFFFYLVVKIIFEIKKVRRIFK